MRTPMIASTALAAALFAGGAALAAEKGAAEQGAADKATATMDAGSDQSAALRGEHFELVGRTVTGQNGDTVGEIDNVLVDAQGKPTHVVLGHGGWLGMGEKSIALGFDKLQVTREDVRVTLSDDQLSALPGYEDTTERGAGMTEHDRERQAAEGTRTTTTPPDQSAATPDAGAKVPPDGTVGGPSGASLDATPGVMKEPVKPKPAD